MAYTPPIFSAVNADLKPTGSASVVVPNYNAVNADLAIDPTAAAAPPQTVLAPGIDSAAFGAASFRLQKQSINLDGEGFSLSDFGGAEIANLAFGVYPDGIEGGLTVFGYPEIQYRVQTVDLEWYGIPDGGASSHDIQNYYQYVLPYWSSPASDSSFGDTEVSYQGRFVSPIGLDATLFGTAIVQDAVLYARPGGIPPLNNLGPVNEWRVPAPNIDFRTKTVSVTRPPEAGEVSDQLTVTHFVQWVDLAGSGTDGANLPEPVIDFRYRTVFPISVLSLEWGTAFVHRTTFVAPTGWESSTVPENSELVINTRRVYYYTGEADQAEYGNATIFNWRQGINLHNNGWYDTQWNSPVAYNLKREIVVAPFAENVNPDQWPNYLPLVENKDRVLGAFGHISSRVGISTWVRNNAAPVLPEGTDMTLWGAGTFIAHRNRTIQAQGWDSFYNERYTVVWNKADVLGPAGIGDTSAFGRPNPVANLNREVKHHSGWVGPEWGLPFIAFARRFVTPGLFYDVPASFPEVRHNPFPIAPAGIPWQGQVGGHDAMVFRREAFPKSANVHSVEWVGEPIVRNRNQTVAPYAYDQSLFGRPDIQNLVRYIAPEWVNPDYFTPPLISYRTRAVNPTPIAVPVFSVIHRIRKDSPDPPSQQRITLNDANGDGEETDGLGIPPPDMTMPVVKRATIYPLGIDEAAKFGTHKVHSNNITVRSIFEDGLLGEPTLPYTQSVYPIGRGSTISVSHQARLTPLNIYAPHGDQAPPGYTPANPLAHVIRSEAVFGSPAVTNQHRSIGPIPARGDDPTNGFDYYPKWGSATFTLRRRYVAPNGIRSLRFGQIIFLNVPQYVNLDDEPNHQGIAPSTQWGANAIGYPPVQPSLHRPVYPVGFSATLWDTHRVELLHRTIPVSGIPHRGNPESPPPYNTNPWGIALVGYPRRYTIGMGVQTLWGNNLIEFKNRPVYPVGWNNCSLEDGNFDDYRFPMRVIRRNPLVRPAHMGDVTVFGTCTVSHHTRTVYSRGIDSYNSGSHSVKASSTIGAQGWESLLIGDIDRWEAGKIKPHGDDLSIMGTPRMLNPLRPSGPADGAAGAPRIGVPLYPLGIPEIGFAGPSVSNPFGCTNRVVTPLPVLSQQNVPQPVVT